MNLVDEIHFMRTAIEKIANTAAFRVPLPEIKVSNNKVAISCSLSGASIHYTTDGSTPTDQSPVYSEQLEPVSPVTVKAIAIKDGYLNSDVAQKKCACLAAPTISPESGEYTTGGIEVDMSSAEGATIYYTTDGETPTEESTEYTGLIDVTTDTTVKAIAVLEVEGFDKAVSGVSSAEYTFAEG